MEGFYVMKIGKKIIDGFEDYIISDVLPNDYEDISNVYNWITIGSLLFKDYKFIRKRLQDEATANWDNLTDKEKFLVCQYKATSEDRCKEILNEDFEYWVTNFDLKSIDCRKERFAKAKTVLIKSIDYASRFTVIGFLNSTKLVDNYIEQGIEGLESGDVICGLYDFIRGINIYSTNGLPTLNLTMLDGITKQEMIDNIMNCLRNGDY
jgi:hypothetical protein